MIPSDVKSITIKVRPNAKKTRLIEIVDGIYKMDVKAPPEDGKANIEVIKHLSKLTGKQARLIKGKTNRTKVIRFL